jgi:UDP-N-acetylmuramate--alanine ligase
VFRRIRHIHFVGIGGAGMSGIAEVLLNLGYEVSGSDLKRSAVTDRLAGLGARVLEGHAGANLGDTQVVVTSTAVRAENPEVVEARRRGIPVIPRAEMLAELMRLKYGVAVAGSHGKTTTTSMVALVLDRGGLDPTVVVGGRLGVLGSGARLGKGEFMVAEADESDRSFLKLSPTIAVVTNIDREHLDTYHDLPDVQDAFVGFMNKVPFYGAAVVCLDDGPVQDVLPRIERRVVTYGLSPQAQVGAHDVRVTPAGSRYTVLSSGESLGEVRLAVPGTHNVVNSLAAVAVGLELGVAFDAIREGLEAFTGVDRRFQVRGQAGGVTVVDDYGHHPTEIRATLEALRQRAGERRTLVLFQPHRFTRTLALWDDFCRCFHLADVLLLTDVYAASEDPIAGVTAQALAEEIARRGHRHAAYAGDLKQATERLCAEARGGDYVLTLGAGSVWTAGEELLRRRASGAPAPSPPARGGSDEGGSGGRRGPSPAKRASGPSRPPEMTLVMRAVRVLLLRRVEGVLKVRHVRRIVAVKRRPLRVLGEHDAGHHAHAAVGRGLATRVVVHDQRPVAPPLLE